jgi:hypothetical protein
MKALHRRQGQVHPDRLGAKTFIAEVMGYDTDPARLRHGDRLTGARSVLAVSVDDVDAACAELARHGVALLDGRWTGRGEIAQDLTSAAMPRSAPSMDSK